MNYLRGYKALNDSDFSRLLSSFAFFLPFSERRRFTVVSGHIENHTPRAVTFEICQLKLCYFCSFQIISSMPAYEPIHKASVFLLLSLRPNTLLKFSKILRAS